MVNFALVNFLQAVYLKSPRRVLPLGSNKVPNESKFFGQSGYTAIFWMKASAYLESQKR